MALEIYKIEGKVSARALDNEYNANEVSADEKYKGKYIWVTGTVHSINKGILGSPYLALNGRNMFLPLHADFDKDSAKELAKVRKGSTVNLVCRVKNYAVGTVMMDECENISSWTSRNERFVKDFVRDVLSGKSSGNENVDNVVRMSYIAATRLPGESVCKKQETLTKQCMADFNALSKLPQSEKQKMKEEMQTLWPKKN